MQNQNPKNLRKQNKITHETNKKSHKTVAKQKDTRKQQSQFYVGQLLLNSGLADILNDTLLEKMDFSSPRRFKMLTVALMVRFYSLIQSFCKHNIIKYKIKKYQI